MYQHIDRIISALHYLHLQILPDWIRMYLTSPFHKIKCTLFESFYKKKLSFCFYFEEETFFVIYHLLKVDRKMNRQLSILFNKEKVSDTGTWWRITLFKVWGRIFFFFCSNIIKKCNCPTSKMKPLNLS